jgi:hypothetical protein
MWIPAFAEIAKRLSMTLVAAIRSLCPWQERVHHALRARELGAECTARQNDWYTRIVPETDPDVIFLVHQAFDDPNWPSVMIAPDGKLLTPKDEGFTSMIVDASRATLRALEQPGRRIVIVEPIPLPPKSSDNANPLSCISTSSAADCSFTARTAREGPTPVELFYRHTGEPGVISADLDLIVCPRLPTCDEIVNNVIVRRDPTHVTATFARAHAADVLALLERKGVFASR